MMDDNQKQYDDLPWAGIPRVKTDVSNTGNKKKVKVWLQAAEVLYENPADRKNTILWYKLLKDNVYVSEDTYAMASRGLKRFFKTHPYLPHNVIHAIERLEEEHLLAEIYEQLDDFDAFYVQVTAGQTTNEISSEWSIDDYIREFRSCNKAYRNTMLSAKSYLDSLNELVSKGYESIYDMKDRVVLCLLLGIDGSALSKRLAEFGSTVGISTHSRTASQYSLYGYAATLYYEEKYEDAIQVFNELSDYTQVGITESIDADGMCIHKLIDMSYEKMGTTLFQEYEKIARNDEYKKRAMRENAQYEYYITCADYHYMQQDFSACLKIVDWLDGILGKHQEALEKKWGSALFAKRYRHNLYLIAQCQMAGGDYEAALLYAQLLYDEDDRCVKAYSIHMQAAFFLHQYYTAMCDYQRFMDLLLYYDKLVDYHDDRPHFMAAFIQIAWAFHDLNRPKACGSPEDCYHAAYEILSKVQELAYFSAESAYLLEVAKKKIGIADPKLLVKLLSMFLKESESGDFMEKPTQETMSQWNPLLLYYYAIGQDRNETDKPDIFLYLYERYGVYGMACVYLSLRHQHQYFHVNFKKQEMDKALEYLKLQVKDSDNGNDQVFLGLFYFRIMKYEEAARAFTKIFPKYRGAKIWYWLAMTCSRKFGLDGKGAYANAISHGYDTADMWYSYGKYVLVSGGASIPFEGQLEEAAKCADHLMIAFPESKWKGLLLWADICLWKSEIDNTVKYINMAYELAEGMVDFEDRLSLYRRLLYISWLCKDTAKAWELAKEVEQYITKQCDNSEKRLICLCEWWVYVARIMLNVSVPEAIAYLQEQIEQYGIAGLVLTSPQLAKAGMKIYKKMIMLSYLNDQNQVLQGFASAFMTCFQVAYPQGTLEDYINMKENLPERMDEVGWYYMAIGNAYLAESCFKKQISEFPCHCCRAGVCYKGYLNLARWRYRQGDKKSAKSSFSWMKLPEVCKKQLLR